MVSVDVDSERTGLARENLRRAGLEDRVELRTEDAAATLARSADAEWEFVFLDAERPAYPGYLRDLARTLTPGGVLAVDNVESHAHELVEFTSLIEAEPELTQTVVPVGAGLRLAVRDASRGLVRRRRSLRERRVHWRRSPGLARRHSASARRKNVASSRSPMLSAWMM